eukprot:14888333-Heterocapsa_arctica.AAC.1
MCHFADGTLTNEGLRFRGQMPVPDGFLSGIPWPSRVKGETPRCETERSAKPMPEMRNPT